MEEDKLNSIEMRVILPNDSKNIGGAAYEQDPLMNDTTKSESQSITTNDTDDDRRPYCTERITLIQNYISGFYNKHRSTIRRVGIMVLVLLFSAYLIYASYLNVKRAAPLLVITSLVIVWLFYQILYKLLSASFYNQIWKPLETMIIPKWYIIKWVLIAIIVLAVVVVVAVIIGDRVEQYRGLLGLVFFLTVLFVTSYDPSKVNWRPVLWGLLLNFIFALFILKTHAGFVVFKTLANLITTFLTYADEGAKFVFGKETYTEHFFAFKILPTIVFFSCVISLLYYVGVMQAVIRKLALVMQITMGTTAPESLSCAGNIFVGQTEAPILVRPFLVDMTNSELHAVMTGGFATIAGGVLAAFIGMGIDAAHLIAASVMNAPMSLAVSKLTYPQISQPKYIQGHRITFAKPTEQNFIEAAAAGASQSIVLVANIAANLIAFLALLAFVNAALSWIGSLVDYPDLSFELICSYLFWLVAYLMGVDYEDCDDVAKLIGIKLVINEFVAYEKLGEIIKSASISKKSEVIATYALCGFANLSSVGIQLGGIGAMVPTRRSDLAKLVIRALFAGSVATLMTATLAGILITDYTDQDVALTTTPGNMTELFNTTTAYTNSTQL